MIGNYFKNWLVGYKFPPNADVHHFRYLGLTFVTDFCGSDGYKAILPGAEATGFNVTFWCQAEGKDFGSHVCLELRALAHVSNIPEHRSSIMFHHVPSCSIMFHHVPSCSLSLLQGVEVQRARLLARQ